jgi:hypothetical protein
MYYFRQCYLVHSAIRKQRVVTIPSNPIRPFFIIILALDKELSLIRPYVVKKEVQLHKKGSAMYKKKVCHAVRSSDSIFKQTPPSPSSSTWIWYRRTHFRSPRDANKCKAKSGGQ